MVNIVHCQPRRTGGPGGRAAGGHNRRARTFRWALCWLAGAEERRPPLTRQRVVAQALAIIAQDGVEALTMRSLAARLGVVPGALYRHVRNKEQLQDLVLDGVLAEV